MKQFTLILLIMGSISCSPTWKNPDEKKTQDEGNYFFMVVKSQISCSHAVMLNKKGQGSMIIGEADLHDESVTQFKSEDIKIIKYFNIKVDDLQKIDNLTNKVLNSEDTIGVFVRDGMKFELYINGLKKMSYYGEPNSTFKELYEILKFYFPTKKDLDCLYTWSSK